MRCSLQKKREKERTFFVPFILSERNYFLRNKSRKLNSRIRILELDF